MTGDKHPKPADAASARRDRLADALRENLRRRKTQSRARSAEEAVATGEALPTGKPRSTTRKP